MPQSCNVCQGPTCNPEQSAKFPDEGSHRPNQRRAYLAARKIVSNASIGLYGMLDIPRFVQSKFMGFGQLSLHLLNFTALDSALFDQHRF